MGMAPLAYCLWQRVLRFDPADPIWPNRDRFVLSAGHASMLLYALLHLTGTKAVDAHYEVPGEPSVTLDDIRHFRQLDSKCPGHPEYRWTSGVETTTGPLGQGVATSVGMAIAARWLAVHFNRPDFSMFDYDVYALAGDGDMMEGLSGEAASLAGHLRLANLCWFYDNNHVTIEGSTALAFSEDVAARFLGYGWNVTRVGDANDLTLLERYWGEERVYHHTAPISMNYALLEALRLVAEEGLPARFARHRLNHAALAAGLAALGLELAAEEGHRLPMLNAVTVPEGVDEARVRGQLLAGHGIEIGGGLGPMKGRVWRIGLMGESSQRVHVLAVLAALEEALRAERRLPAPGAVVAAAQAVYDA